MAAAEVFVTGAGFSRAISREMPLLRPMSRKVFGDDVLSRPSLSSLASNFETLLTYLSEDHPWLPEAENLRNRSQFLDASRSLARVILEAQRKVLAKPMPSWLGDIVRYWHEHQSTIVTFNYDTLVEKSYTTTIPAVPLSPVDHQEVYRVPVVDIRSRRSGRFGRGDPRDTLALLKLHGSINWCYSGAPSFFGETIYDLQMAAGWVGSADPVDDLERKAPDKTHLVVPPTTAKSTLFNNEVVRTQWRLARTALENADPVYCLGYSLPETDQMVRYLIGTVEPGKVIVPVDLSLAVARRYARLLSGHSVMDGYIARTEPIPRFVSDLVAGRLTLGDKVSPTTRRRRRAPTA